MTTPVRYLSLAAALTAAVFFASCTSETPPPTSTTSGGTGRSTSAPSKPRPAPRAAAGAVGQPAFDFALEDSEGRQVQLSDFEGKVVVLDFWATWCPPCRKEIPGFVALQEKYRDQGVEVVGVSLDDDWDPVIPFMESYDINYTIVLGSQEVVQNYGRFRGIPTTFVIDREGVIREKHEGYAPPQVFERAVEKLL